MSYGNQLNIFKAQSQRYGMDWRALIACPNEPLLNGAVRDAMDLLGGDYSRSRQVLSMPNGATLHFRMITSLAGAQAAFGGKEFTQISWLHRPAGSDKERIIDCARAALRSRTVPAADWRYEYCFVR